MFKNDNNNKCRAIADYNEDDGYVCIYNEKARQDKTRLARAGTALSLSCTTPKQARECEKKLDNKLELRQNSLMTATTSASKCIKCILFSCNKLRD